MSRIGKKPITVPGNVKLAVDGQHVSVEGKLGKMERLFESHVDIKFDGASKSLVVSRRNDERTARAYHGLTRALIQNMVDGVSKGFEKKLEIVGVGYGANLKGDRLEIRVGYANEIHKTIPAGLTVTCPDQTPYRDQRL